MSNSIDASGLVWHADDRGHDKIIGGIHRSNAGRYEVVMVGKAVAKSLRNYDEAKAIAEDWQPDDDDTRAILAKILA